MILAGRRQETIERYNAFSFGGFNSSQFNLSAFFVAISLHNLPQSPAAAY